jgi:hypothetical protein
MHKTLNFVTCIQDLDQLGPMRGTAIPNHQEQTREQAQQLSEKSNDFLTGDRMLVSLQKQPTLGCDYPDERKMIIRQKLFQDGRPATRSRSAHDEWQQVNARFVYEDDGSPFFGRLFFNSGQHFSFKRWISAPRRSEWASGVSNPVL